MNPSRHNQEGLREAVLRKALDRGQRTLGQVAAECGMPLSTLKNWLKKARKNHRKAREVEAQHSPGERLDLLLQAAALSVEERAAFCRQRGLYLHQLEAWKQEFATPAVDVGLRVRCDALARECTGLKAELRRKDQALAEAAALLVLSKKYQALLAAGDE